MVLLSGAMAILNASSGERITTKATHDCRSLAVELGRNESELALVGKPRKLATSQNTLLNLHTCAVIAQSDELFGSRFHTTRIRFPLGETDLARRAGSCMVISHFDY